MPTRVAIVLILLTMLAFGAGETAGGSFSRVRTSFEPNLGQAAGEALFLANAGANALQFRRHGLVLLPAGADQPAVELQFLGASPASRLTGGAPLPGIHNYYRAARTVERVPQFGTLRYANLYAGTDLLFYGQGDHLEYDFELQPGADPRAIRFRFAGADRVRALDTGDLLIESGGRSFRHLKPVSYQTIGGRRIAVASRFEVGHDGAIGFAVGDYDRSQPLTIDPILTFFWRKTGVAANSAVDAAGSVYVTGKTGDDVFVQKLTSSGVESYYTVLGGTRSEDPGQIAVDALGNVYVTGRTASSDLPTLNPLTYLSINGAARSGASDAFLAKFNAAGTRVFSSYFGGNGDETGTGIATDSTGGEIVAVGSTTSTDLPSGPGPSPGNQYYAVVFNLASSTPVAIYFELSRARPNVVKDPAGMTYFAGAPNWVQRWGRGGRPNYGFFLGGVENPNIVVTSGYADALGNFYVAGFASQDGLPITANALRSTRVGTDAFVAKIDNTGTVVYCTYVGGNGTDQAFAVTADTFGNMYVAGKYSASGGFLTANGQPAPFQGGSDVFVVKVQPRASNSKLLFSYFFGSPTDDAPVGGMAQDGASILYLAGNVGLNPVVDALNLLGTPNTAGDSMFVAKFAKADIRARTISLGPPPGFATEVAPNPGKVALEGPGRRKAGIDPGGTIQYVGEFSNQPHGPSGSSSTADKVQVTAGLPPSVEIAPVGNACVLDGKNCGNQVSGFQAPVVAEVPVGGTVGLTLQLKVKGAGSPGAPTPGSTVTISFAGNADTDDPVPENNEVTETFRINVPITVTTSPITAPVTITAEGVTTTGNAPQSRSIDPLASFSLTVDSFLPPAAGSRYRFANWTIGAQTFNTPTVNVPRPAWPSETLQANFQRQFQVTAGSTDPTRGSVALSPVTDGYFDEGSTVTATAVPAAGFKFSAFSGSITSTTNPASAPVAGPLNILAAFECAYNLSFLNRRQPFTGGSSQGTVTTGPGCPWTATTDSPSWITLTDGVGPGTKSFTYTTPLNTQRAKLGSVFAGGEKAKIMLNGDPSIIVFNDVQPALTEFDYISLLQSQNITAGCSANPPLFCPSSPVTRAQMAVFMVLGLRQEITVPPNSTTPYFQDVAANSGFFPFIQSIKELGITAGCSAAPPLYCPDASITHGQMAVFMILSWLRATNQTTFTFTQTPYFTDVPANHPFFRFIQKMRDLGFRTGCSATTYCPDSLVTRAEMAPLILRAILGAP